MDWQLIIMRYEEKGGSGPRVRVSGHHSELGEKKIWIANIQ